MSAIQKEAFFGLAFLQRRESVCRKHFDAILCPLHFCSPSAMSGIGAPDLAAVFPWKFTSPIPNLSAVRRRFLGIVGLGAANVTAVLRVIQSLVPPKITLRMVLSAG